MVFVSEANGYLDQHPSCYRSSSNSKKMTRISEKKTGNKLEVVLHVFESLGDLVGE